VIFRWGEFQLDDLRLELRREGVAVPLRPQTRELLLYLVRHRERVVSKRELIEKVWSGVTVTEGVLAQAMMLARRALDDDGEEPKVVRTVRGHGYRFVAEVEERNGAVVTRGFVGRAAQLEVLDERLARAAQGRGNIVLLGGEPGIGKTKLLDVFVARARANGARVLTGRADEEGGAPSLWPWAEMLSAYAQETGERVPALVATESADDRFAMFRAVAALWTAAARATPLVLVVDDLHAADQESLVFLKFIAREIDAARILVVVAYREAAISADYALARVLGALSRSDPTRLMKLGPLDAAEIAALATDILGRAPEPETARRLDAKTAGNPLLLTQFLHMMQMAEWSRGTAGDSTSAMLEEVTMREAIGLHLADLSTECARVLTLAAVLGREFAVAPLSVLAKMEMPALIEVMEEALRARVVARQTGSAHRYRFVHALVRDLLYKGLTGKERLELHSAAGDALVEHDPTPDGVTLDAVASHYVAAAALGDVARAVAWSVRAARAASDRAAYDAAERHLRAAHQTLELARGSVKLVDEPILSALDALSDGACADSAHGLRTALRARGAS
jgi:predicted ATPase/DNA-binding winged helix-turn-helix (wHTH) protein